MKIKKIVLVLILYLLVMLLTINNIYASQGNSAIVKLNRNNTSPIKVGDEIAIDVDISVTGFQGIIEFLADVEYDKEVLEYTDVVLQEDWNLISSNEKVYIEQRDMKDSQGKICSLKFKVLKETKDTTIKLNGIDAAGVSGSVYWLDGNVDIPSITLNFANGSFTNQSSKEQSSSNESNNQINNQSNRNSQSNKTDETKAYNENKNLNNNIRKETSNASTESKSNNTKKIYFVVGIVLTTAIIIAIGVILFIKCKTPKEEK